MAAQFKALIHITILLQQDIIGHLRLFLVCWASWGNCCYHGLYFILIEPLFVFCIFLVFFYKGLGWSYPCDLWSVGCILAELCSVCHPTTRLSLMSLAYIKIFLLGIIFHLINLCRERYCFKHVKIWSIWPWWKGF